MNINPNTKDAYKLLHKGTISFAKAEQQGFRVDMEYAEQAKLDLTTKINKLEGEFKNTNFFKYWDYIKKGKANIYSNPQLGHYLYTVKKIEPSKTTVTGKGSTDEEALKDLDIPELNTLLELRKWKKARDTYLVAFLREQVNGYIHPFYNLHLARTFRSSSDSPNFQNIPKRDKEVMTILRKALYPRPGHQLLEVDYGQLEVRIAACYNKDPKLIDDILHGDMHADMAQEIFMIKDFDKTIPEHSYLRGATKNGFVFPQFYGDYFRNCAEGMACKWCELPHDQKWRKGQGINMPKGTIADHLIKKGIKSLTEFTDHIKDIENIFWFDRYHKYAKWKEIWWKRYQKRGYIDLKTGFRCSGIMKKNDCINYPVQGAAFHCLLWSFIELTDLFEKMELKTKLIGQIHDAIIFDVNTVELETVLNLIKQVTTEDIRKAWPWIIVPLEVDAELCPVDKSWAEKEEIKI